MIILETNYLMHYGVLRKSGRYPWGSGGDQQTRNKSFIDYFDDLKKQGLSEADAARGVGLSTTEVRAARSIAVDQQKQDKIGQAQRLKDKGYSNVAIGDRMGLNESSVRALLSPGFKDRADVLQTTANMLRDQVVKKGMIDVGSGVERHIGVSETKLKTAVAVLKEEGHTVHYVKVEQLGTGNQTTMKVLAGKDVSYSDVFKNRANIKQITDFSEDGGRSFGSIQKPLSIDSKRIAVKYAEDGGGKADGVIYVRPGVHDLSLGSARYAQVRIAVDNSHYLKGMAVYKDDLPKGTDLQFNTNKTNTGHKLDAMKSLKDDPDNPFGSIVRQIKDPHDKNKVTSAMNVVNEQGNWEEWSKNLSSQFLSKQSPSLAKSQLNMTYEQKKHDLDEIKSLTNPAVRKKLLETFADDSDSSAVHLKAAHLPRQGNHVILPIDSLKETEIYAPNFHNGEQVVLVRHPHGGIFELPQLTVNNNNTEAKRTLGRAPDAVGIHSKVAKRLSGADFDGDTVLVIPNNHGKIKTASALESLKNFDPQHSYKLPDGQKFKGNTQQLMGGISNLITDMTIRGANHQEIARAVRHSMVVIDAEKHDLNYKQSALDAGILQLKHKYQGGGNAGASTLISKAKSEIRIPERKPRSAAAGGPIDKATGHKVFESTGETFTKNNKVIVKTRTSTKLAETDDAHTLSSGTSIEKIYADHSNKLKSLANEARKESANTKGLSYSPSAKQTYASEVKSLDAKLNIAIRNRPLERQAHLLAKAQVDMKRAANPDMDKAEIKKLNTLALGEARRRTGAGKQEIVLTDKEWAAIQSGAISTNKLNQILNNANLDKVKELATPRRKVLMTSIKKGRALSMLRSGYTQAEIAAALGVSLTTLKNSLE